MAWEQLTLGEAEASRGKVVFGGLLVNGGWRGSFGNDKNAIKDLVSAYTESVGYAINVVEPRGDQGDL